MSSWFFNVHMHIVMKEVKVGMRRMRVRLLDERREWILPGLLYGDDLVLCGKSEEDLKVIVGCLVVVCRRRGLRVNADKSKVMVLGGEEDLE